jgi:hypothetical protein
MKDHTMKKIIAAVAATLSASSALAGSITYVAPEMLAIEEPARMGGSGAWLIPLIIAAVIILALSRTPGPTGPVTPTDPTDPTPTAPS